MERDHAAGPAALRVNGVSVSFGGVVALDDVSLEVSRGEVLGVIGPNGAGKTTLFNVICGFVVPDAGTISWRGEPFTRIHPHRLTRLGIARTLQGVGLFERLTLLENVMVGAERFRRSKPSQGCSGCRAPIATSGPFANGRSRRFGGSTALTPPTVSPRPFPTQSASARRWRARSSRSPSC